jgi:hypothetical protein
VVGIQNVEHDIIESSGKGAEQFKTAVGWLDTDSIHSILAGFLDLTRQAASGRGSYALSQDASDLYMLSRTAVLKEMAATITSWLIGPLVRYNYGPDAAVPRFEFAPLTEEDVEQALGMFKALLSASAGQGGAVDKVPAEFIEELIEKVSKLLDLDTGKVAEALRAARRRRHRTRARGRCLRSGGDPGS